MFRLPDNEKYTVCRDTAEDMMKEMSVTTDVVPIIVAFSGNDVLFFSRVTCGSKEQ